MSIPPRPDQPEPEAPLPVPQGATPRGSAPEAAAPVRGILLMLGTGLIFSVMDTLSKGLTREYPVLQVIWGRYAFHMLIMLIALSPRRPWLVLARSRRPMLQLGRSLA